MSPAALRWLGMAAALVILLADQASKAWILYGLRLPELGSLEVLPVLNLTMVWNRGVTFGLLNGFGSAGPVLLTGVALAVVVALGVWLWRAERPLVAVALGAVAGGAVGNVIDRLRFGAVVDFIHAHAWGWSWYVFNVADAAIVCGVSALVLESLFTRHHPSSGERLARVRDGR
ncbi:Lipoprotein signal peptidase [Rhodovastum atsumiense]|uniref:signal peptidase II n=1 Tax=Rhodovastum atsumiense TaxID=504468 RepID=UPI00193BD2CB|nr:signal peptidase II [Rhodovastum atsumiense]CAH2601195.1 Lipoprotein signal peptidase [Rhodovastum atsumiense]